MKKQTVVAVLAILIMLLVLPAISLGDSGFAVGPSYIYVTVPEDGQGKGIVYITSSFTGELVVGTEDIPLRVDPETIPVSSDDRNKKVELTFYGNRSVEKGLYSGKLTFLSHGDNNVAYGVKIKADVTQVGKASGENGGNSIVNAIKGNCVVIILSVLVVVALVVGILIGRKRG